MTIDTKHLQEWTVDSGVDPELTSLNVRSLHGTEAYDYLLISDDIPRRNDGRIRSYLLRRYEFTEKGGYACDFGVNPLDLWHEQLSGCFKPNRPRRDPNKPGKRIKYEHPPKTELGTFVLRVPFHIQERIAKRYGMLESLRLHMDNPVYNLKGEKLSVYAQFWGWVLIHPEIPLTITEGAKKAGALLTAGYCAIALPGVNAGYRLNKNSVQPTRKLAPCLKPFAKNGRKFSLAFDQDSKRQTIERVSKAQERLGYLLREQGCEAEIVTWNSSQGKGADDLIVNHGSEAFDQAVQLSCLFDVWRARRYNLLTYTTHVQLDQRYIGELNLPESARLVGIKSPKGTGKTESLVPIVAEAIHEGQRVLILGHRNLLVEALCKRFGLNHITEVRNSEEGEAFGYGLCVDSLHPESQARFDPEDWEGCLIIGDEIEQILWHLLNSNTCSKERVSILRSFKRLFQVADRAILADADLSDVGLDYISSLMGGIEPYLINNEYKTETPWDVYQYSKPELLVEALKEAVEERQEKPLICLSAQKEKSLFGTCNQESYFREQFPDLKILRIDSETVSDINHNALGCIAHLNELLPDYDLAITSPCLETGVSIDIKGHFTSVWCIAQGVQAESSVRQSLCRLREPVPRHIYAAPYGLSKIGHGETSYKSLMKSQEKMLKVNIKLLQATDTSELWENLDELDQLQNFQPETLRCWARMVMRHNAGMIRYAETIFSELEAEGHNIIPVDSDSDGKNTKEKLEESRDELYLNEREAITNVNPFESESQFRASDEKRAKSKDDRRRERQWTMGRKYGECTPVLLEADDKKLYSKLELEYLLTVGKAYLQLRDRAKAKSQIDKGALFPPDFNPGQKGFKVYVLEQKLGILKFLSNPDREFKNSDPDLIELRETVLPIKRDIRQAGLGTIKESDSPVNVLQKLLNNLGIKPTRFRRESQRGTRHWIYKIQRTDWKQQVFAFWLQRDEEKLLRSESSELVRTQTMCPNPVINNRGISDRDTETIIQDLNTCEPDALQDMVRSFLRADWWSDVRIDVWGGVRGAVRRLIDALDVEVSYGF